MHSAPSVSYPVGRSRFAAVLVLGGWLLGAAAIALWSAQVQLQRWWLVVAVVLVLAAGACAAWNWRHASGGTLNWDGDSWSWPAAAGQGGTGTLEIGLDLQRWLLLRWTGGSASRWLWLERASRPQRWDDLRRAVYSRASPHPLRQAQTPASTP